MPVSKSSGSSPSSRPVSKPPAPSTGRASLSLGRVLLILMVIASSCGAYSWSRGYTLYDGDAEAHLNIARRLLDSRTPGPEQIGTGWLPLPHLAMAPFAMVDGWWKSGLAGALPSMLALVAAGGFLFAAARRILSASAGLAAALFLALNPNILYLSGVPMTEMLFLASLCALLWATAWFEDTRSWWAVLAASLASNAASLTRYEGWFLIPFAALFFLFRGSRGQAAIFGLLALAAPVAWLAHNQFYYSDALEFYRGEWSAAAVHRRSMAAGVVSPTDHNWKASVSFYIEAVRLTAGMPLAVLALGGGFVALLRRAWWPLVLLVLCPAFYVLSLHSSGADLYVPTFWPQTAYNTRYAAAGILLLAFAAGGIVTILPQGVRTAAACILPACVLLLWAMQGAAPVAWQEASTNSAARRAAQAEAARFLAANYRTGAGLVYPFGTLSGVLREAGIPLKQALHEGNHPAWDAAAARPGVFLREEWAVAVAGDSVASMIEKARGQGRPYRLRKRVTVKGAPSIEIYHFE